MSGNQHPFANPGPAGQAVLIFYLVVLFANMTGQGGSAGGTLLIGLGLAGGIVQFAVGVMELKNGQVLKGNIFLAFSAFMFMGMCTNWLEVSGLVHGSLATVQGYVFLLMGLILVGATYPVFYTHLANTLFFLAADVFFLGMAGGLLLQNPNFIKIAAWDLPVAIVVVMWIIWGDIINGTFGKTVIKMGPAPLKRKG